jgi:stage II sporulation protein D
VLAIRIIADSPRSIRVVVLQNVSSLRLKVRGFYEVIDAKNNKLISRAKNLNTTVTPYSGGILLGDMKSYAEKVLIKSVEPEAAVINGRRFRGDVELIKKDNGNLLVLNFIDLEDYVKGILYHEVSHYWPLEALKAQAIISRTYAVYQVQENRQKDFDVTSDIYSQVYGGRTSERYRTNIAVEETKGSILTYNNKPFPAYFHATCAGHTEDASLLWNIDIPPLKGVVCNFCRESPHFKWHLVLYRGELRQRLVNAGYNMGMIKEIIVLGKDNSARITDLKIVTTTKDLTISAKDFRNIIGPNEIRSTNFTVSIAGDDAVFEGIGWGHGVGLCQWGAYFMAKQGKSAEEILKYYYPASRVSLILNP